LEALLIERRNGKRFQADWPIKVTTKTDGGEFSEEGTLSNISSGGALVVLPQPVSQGMELEVYIKLPFKQSNWMKYSAHVVRVEKLNPGYMAAVRFAGARPQFAK
jgi:c-di-GMP-binding flagellar brake protein YcgR